MGSFLKELAEEGNVKFGFAKKLGINQIKLLEIEGGRNTVSMDIENGTFTPEKLLAMEEAIKSYLRQKDKENRYQEGYQSKLKIYKEKVARWEEEKGDDYWEERNRKWALLREKLPYNSVSRKSAKIYEKFIKLTTLYILKIWQKRKQQKQSTENRKPWRRKRPCPHFSLTCFPLPATRSLTERCWSTTSCIRHR